MENSLNMPETLRYTVGHTVSHDPSLRLWAGLLLFAVFGSLAFGASLTLAAPDLATWRLAIWFAGAAGAAWCIFIPAIIQLSGESWRSCAQIALVTMAAGEIVLIGGAALHLCLWLCGAAPAGASLHILAVVLSNVAMAAVFTVQFRERGVPIWKPLVWWMTILNGTGALFFALGYSLLLRS